jgi:hypothetical protein
LAKKVLEKHLKNGMKIIEASLEKRGCSSQKRGGDEKINDIEMESGI